MGYFKIKFYMNIRKKLKKVVEGKGHGTEEKNRLFGNKILPPNKKKLINKFLFSSINSIN